MACPGFFCGIRPKTLSMGPNGAAVTAETLTVRLVVSGKRRPDTGDSRRGGYTVRQNLPGFLLIGQAAKQGKSQSQGFL